MPPETMTLDTILARALDHQLLSRDEIIFLLTLEEETAIRRLMECACRLRNEHFGNAIFLYGFVYYSTYCRNDCRFCYYRRTNTSSPRYRKNLAEIVEISEKLVDSGVHLIDLTSGEDPALRGDGGFARLTETIAAVKQRTGAPVMVSPGVVPDEIVTAMEQAGADWYALYQETYNPELYARLRTGQPFADRVAGRRAAHRAGMLVEDGLLLGVGETVADRADSLLAMQAENLRQVRVMSFVPQENTPLEHLSVPSRMIEYLGIAVLRLLMPDRLIPATLDVEGIGGLKMRLAAGANVVTSIIPPRDHLAGVAQSSLDVEQGLRTVVEVRKIISRLGLVDATREAYAGWVEQRRNSN
jgi:methylornithine synthase